MNTFFISTSTKKDLERIKKLFKRHGFDFTVNSKQLFIVAWSKYDTTWFIQHKIRNNGAIINTLTLHEDHPLLKQNDDTENLTPLPFAQ